jgi:hypothetical protein
MIIFINPGPFMATGGKIHLALGSPPPVLLWAQPSLAKAKLNYFFKPFL